MSGRCSRCCTTRLVVLRARRRRCGRPADGSMGSAPIARRLRLRRAGGRARLAITVDGEPASTSRPRRDGADAVALRRPRTATSTTAAPIRTCASSRAARRDPTACCSESITITSRLDRRSRTERRGRVCEPTHRRWSRQGRARRRGPRRAPSHASVGAGATATVDGIALEAPGATVRADDGIADARWRVERAARTAPRRSASVSSRSTTRLPCVRGATTPVPWTRARTRRAATTASQRWVARALDDLDALRLTRPREPGDAVPRRGRALVLHALRPRLDLGRAASCCRSAHGLAGEHPARPRRRCRAPRRRRRRPPSSRARSCTSCAAAASRSPARASRCRRSTTAPSTRRRSGSACCTTPGGAGLPDDEVRGAAAAPRAPRSPGCATTATATATACSSTSTRPARGLANQGWKDSGDSVQWRDGTLAEGPIALCEVQAYAYEAAMHGAELLEAFGRDGATSGARGRRGCATRFRETLLDRRRRRRLPGDRARRATSAPVDTVTSNLGHLLGTGLLRRRRVRAGRRAGSARPELDSGFGLRTMSTDSAGYWPLELPRRQRVDPRHRDRDRRASRATGFDARRDVARRGPAARRRSPSTTGCPSCTRATAPRIRARARTRRRAARRPGRRLPRSRSRAPGATTA